MPALFRPVLLIAMTLWLGACASLTRLPTPAVTEESRASLVLVSLNQQELEVDKPDVNAGGGLIGALIEAAAESTMDKNRQEAIAPIRDAMIEMQPDALLVEQVRAHLPTRLVRPDAEIRVVRNAGALEEALVGLDGNALVLTTRYAFDSEFRALYVRIQAAYGEVGMVRKGKGSAKPLHSTREQKTGKVVEASYHAQYPLRDYTGGFEANVARWMESGGSSIRRALTGGIAEATALVGRDLGSPIVFDAQRDPRKFLGFGYTAPIALKGALIEEKDGRALLGNGLLLVWTETHAMD